MYMPVHSIYCSSPKQAYRPTAFIFQLHFNFLRTFALSWTIKLDNSHNFLIHVLSYFAATRVAWAKTTRLLGFPGSLSFFLSILGAQDRRISLSAHYRPAFHIRVSAGGFPWKKTCISMHTETRLRNHGIRLVVARRFHCLHKFKVVDMCIMSVWTTCERKSRSSSSVSERG